MKLDYIHLRNIRLPLALTFVPDAWHRRDKPQPAIISVKIGYPSNLIADAAESDSVSKTLDYGKLYRKIEEDMRGIDGDVSLLLSLATVIRRIGFGLVQDTLSTAPIAEDENERDEICKAWEYEQEAEVWIHLPKAILRADRGLTCRTYLKGAEWPGPPNWHEFTIEGIRCNCILGINPHERREKQAVDVGLVFRHGQGANEDIPLGSLTERFQDMSRKVAEAVDSSSFRTVEALATLVSRIALNGTRFDEVTVRVDKPSAQPFVEYSGVEITRSAR